MNLKFIKIILNKMIDSICQVVHVLIKFVLLYIQTASINVYKLLHPFTS